MSKFVQLPMGSSALGSHNIEPFLSCPKEFQYRRVRKLEPRGRTLPVPLGAGLLIHAGRAQWLHDKRRPDSPWKELVADYTAEWNTSEFRKITPEAYNLAVACLKAYVAHWSRVPSTEILAVEYEVAPRPLRPTDPPWAWRTVRYDSIERWRGKTYIGECKSTSSSPSKVMDHYALHVQPLLSVSLWSQVETARFGPLAGILFDIIVKPSGKKPARCVERQPVLLNDLRHALPWFRENFTSWVMQSSAIRWDDSVERRIGSCIRPYGPCDFRHLCLRGLNARQKYQFAGGQPLTTWTPTPTATVEPWV